MDEGAIHNLKFHRLRCLDEHRSTISRVLDRINLEFVEWPQDLVGGLRSAASFIGIEWHNQ